MLTHELQAPLRASITQHNNMGQRCQHTFRKSALKPAWQKPCPSGELDPGREDNTHLIYIPKMIIDELKSKVTHLHIIELQCISNL